ncbi:MAG: FAD-dependent oxidoreductase, partial [bacterium]|nr:FAD-dependent oxidoreductase [bacterium]
MQDKYDLIVVGGGTAGCAAAYTAGKLGVKTLLIEKNSFLGGTITSSLVVPAMKTSKNQINTDFFNELVSELTILGGQTTYQDNKGWFNPELTKIALDRLMQKSNTDVLFNTEVTKISLKNKHIEGICINREILSVCIASKYIVDATGNCEIGKLSNCEFLNTEEEKQPVSLRFEMGG